MSYSFSVSISMSYLEDLSLLLGGESDGPSVSSTPPPARILAFNTGIPTTLGTVERVLTDSPTATSTEEFTVEPEELAVEEIASPTTDKTDAPFAAYSTKPTGTSYIRKEPTPCPFSWFEQLTPLMNRLSLKPSVVAYIEDGIEQLEGH